MSVATTAWEPVIGLEIHVQLSTRTKMFCRCPAGYGAAANTHTCPVCLAFPGALPVPNREAIERTIRLGLALGCEIADRAVFHRKNYFYPDLPKAYQISQYDEPLCRGGQLLLPGPDGDVAIGIVRAHLEEDAAKTLHVGESGRIDGATATLVDFNRGGTPLVEIVTQPDIHDSDTAKRFLQLLRQTVIELGISDAELDKGSMRFDVNVSVRPAGTDELRTRTELKNMNSFAFAAKGIEREVARQIRIYEGGGEVEQETLHFDPTQEEAPPLRSKEEAQDYRYFPEPDLVPVHPPAEVVDRLRGEPRAARVADSPDRRHALVLRRRRARHRRAGSALGGGGRRGRRSEGGRERPREPFVAAVPIRRRATRRSSRSSSPARQELTRAAFDEADRTVGREGFSAAPYLARSAQSPTPGRSIR